jgi:AraC-like DNA-binding protein
MPSTVAPAEWTRYAVAADHRVECLHAHYADHVYDRHSHDGYAVGVTESGVQTFTCRGAAHASTLGTVMAFNPDDPHDGQSGAAEGFTYRMIYIRPDAIRDVLEDANDGVRSAAGSRLPFFREPLIRDAAIARAVIVLGRALAERGTPALERDAYVADLLVPLAMRYDAGRAGKAAAVLRGSSASAIERVRDFLHADLAADISADHLAVVAGMSRFHLARLFRQRYGLPPHAYRLQLRLAEAKRLLAAGEPAAEIAAATGFADQSHLTKRFKGAFGITPGQFARALTAAGR